MSDRVSELWGRFWRTYRGGQLCAWLGHAGAAWLPERGNEDCDCCDHAYLGCPRCGTALD